MNTNFKIFSVLLILFIFSACTPSPKKASEYNNRLITQQRLVIEKMDNLISSFSTYNAEEMKNAYNDLLNTINKALDNVAKMDEFDGSTEFRDRTIKLLKIYKQVTENEFLSVLNLLSKPENQYTSNDARVVSELMMQARNKITEANNQYKQYQQQFAQKYHLNLVSE